MTCPTTACYNGLPVGEEDGQGRRPAPLLRRRLSDQQEARRPALLAHAGDGRRVHLRGDVRHDARAVAGGNFIILGDRPGRRPRAPPRPPSRPSAQVPGVILPFPGGVVRSGSKVGSPLQGAQGVSTNDAYCPTLRGQVASRLPDERPTRSTRSSSTASTLEAVEARHARRRPGRVPARESCRSPPATTAASSASTSSHLREILGSGRETVETVVTTLDEDGEANFAAMGVVWGEDRS